MKKLNFIRQSSSGGGAEKYLYRLTSELIEKGIKCNVVHSSFPKWLPSWLRVLLFNTLICLNKKDNFYFSLDRISCADIYRAGDGVHKVYLKEKGFSLNPLHLVYLFLEKRCFKNSKKIIANSKMIKKEIIDTYKIENDKIEVIYNGIPLKEKVNFQDIKDEFSLKNEKIILFVGSGFERKGVKEFLDIVSKIDFDIKAFVIGKEKRVDFYKNYAKKLNIENRVFFTGARDDVDKFYSLSDIFLFPTHYEPFSNVILEAMNFENVSFTTLKNGASEILPKEWIIDNNIVEKINSILRDEKELQIQKKRAKEIAKNFSIEKNTKETLRVIDEVTD